jgi:transcriptional regulator with XRE-family HTH domain
MAIASEQLTSSLLTTVITGNCVDADRLAETLNITKNQLAEAIGLARESLYKQERMRTAKTQSRLRDVVEILNRTTPWCGSVGQAFAWFRSQGLPAFGDRTAETLVKMGLASEVKEELNRIAHGGYA